MMSRIIKKLGVLLAVCAVFSVQAAEHLADRRSNSVPIIDDSSGKTSVPAGPTPGSIVDLLKQIDQLQTQVQQLQNQVEVQNHELEKLKTRDADLSRDFDQRIHALEQGASHAAPVSSGPNTASATAADTTPKVAPQEQQEYDAAFILMKQGEYERASQTFRAFITHHPQSGLASNAQYWIAEANYVLRNFKISLEEFNKVVSLYPASPKVPDATLKIGYIDLELGADDRARAVFQDIIRHYPGTTAANLAQQRLDKIGAVNSSHGQ